MPHALSLAAASPTASVGPAPAWSRWGEMSLLFGAAPALILSGVWPMEHRMVLLGAAAAFCTAVLLRNRVAGRELGLSAGAVSGGRCIAWGAALWLALSAGVAWVRFGSGEPLLPLIDRDPRAFLELSLAYTFSVVAQELVFRGYFFWRYADAAPLPVLALANCACFGWIHIIYGSWISVGLSAAGGLVFTALFLRYRHLPAVVVVHIVFGLTVFAMGWGAYFLRG